MPYVLKAEEDRESEVFCPLSPPSFPSSPDARSIDLCRFPSSHYPLPTTHYPPFVVRRLPRPGRPFSYTYELPPPQIDLLVL